jgi:hypothetical protein
MTMRRDGRESNGARNDGRDDVVGERTIRMAYSES